MCGEIDLRNFFQKAKVMYSENKNTYEYLMERFFHKTRVEYKAYIKIKRELDRYLSTDFNFGLCF